MKRLDKRLSIHHIGARGGLGGFLDDVWALKHFEKDIVRVLYDAAPDCIEQIHEINKRSASQFHVFQKFIWEKSATISFNLNYDPNTSSVFPTNPLYGGFYLFNQDHDYVVSGVTKPMETFQIDAVRLDELFGTQDNSVPLPDFLSIDTEGAEYEVLSGAREVIKSSVLGVFVESFIHPLRRGQKVFPDIHDFLTEQGFWFVKFTESMIEYSPYRAPVGLRGEGFHLGGNALYFRRMDSLPEVDERRRSNLLQKLAFIAIVYNQFEYGLDCLLRRKELLKGTHGQLEKDDPGYYGFLTELLDRAEKMPGLFPTQFEEKYTFEASKSRYKASALSSGEEKGDRSFCGILKKRMPLLENVLKKISWLKAGTTFYLARWAHEAALELKCQFGTSSPVESVLIHYGLKNQAKILIMKRLVQSPFVSKRRVPLKH